MALMCYAGDVEAGERAMAPFRALATPLADMVQAQPYSAMYPPEDADYHPLAIGPDDLHGARRRWMRRRDPRAAGRIRCVLARGTGARPRWRDGSRPELRDRLRPPVEQDHGHRGCLRRRARRRPAPGLGRGLSRRSDQGDPGAYVNFLGEEGEERIHDAYPGTTWDRLAAIKGQYDPDNLFHLNQNVPPAR